MTYRQQGMCSDVCRCRMSQRSLMFGEMRDLLDLVAHNSGICVKRSLSFLGKVIGKLIRSMTMTKVEFPCAPFGVTVRLLLESGTAKGFFLCWCG